MISLQLQNKQTFSAAFSSNTHDPEWVTARIAIVKKNSQQSSLASVS